MFSIASIFGDILIFVQPAMPPTSSLNTGQRGKRRLRSQQRSQKRPRKLVVSRPLVIPAQNRHRLPLARNARGPKPRRTMIQTSIRIVTEGDPRLPRNRERVRARRGPIRLRRRMLTIPLAIWRSICRRRAGRSSLKMWIP
jgi:hypothetical protein